MEKMKKINVTQLLTSIANKESAIKSGLQNMKKEDLSDATRLELIEGFEEIKNKLENVLSKKVNLGKVE